MAANEGSAEVESLDTDVVRRVAGVLFMSPAEVSRIRLDIRQAAVRESLTEIYPLELAQTCWRASELYSAGFHRRDLRIDVRVDLDNYFPKDVRSSVRFRQAFSV